MVPGAGLGLRQKQFLDVVLQEEYFLKNFYLSGGTALSSWYLHHRESYDLDFFSDRRFVANQLVSWAKENDERIGYQGISFEEDFGFYTFFLRYPDNSRLKVDFNHYSFSRLEKGLSWRGLEIDSLYDIAVNKIQTIRTNPRARDYVDLYFIFKKTNWSINKLLADADKKFGITIDVLEVSKNLLKVSEITDLPKMLVPFNQGLMEKFFLELARSLKDQIFQK